MENTMNNATVNANNTNKGDVTMEMVNAIIKELVNRGLEAERKVVIKNGVEMLGIVVGKKESIIRPTVYVRDEWEDMEISEIADEICEIVNENTGNQFNIDLLSDKEFIKKNAKLCIQKRGSEDIVKRDYLDLEVYVRVFIDDTASFKVTSQFAENILGDDDIFEIAKENTKGTFDMKGMLDLMAEEYGITREDMGVPEDYVDEQYVVTNEDKRYGASVLFYKGYLKEFCRDLGIEKCYILPSSIHEVIVMQPNENMNEYELDDMVKEVNETQVAPEERLSDHCYTYVLEDDEIIF